jgi:hypothetical protein
MLSRSSRMAYKSAAYGNSGASTFGWPTIALVLGHKSQYLTTAPSVVMRKSRHLGRSPSKRKGVLGHSALTGTRVLQPVWSPARLRADHPVDLPTVSTIIDCCPRQAALVSLFTVGRVVLLCPAAPRVGVLCPRPTPQMSDRCPAYTSSFNDLEVITLSEYSPPGSFRRNGTTNRPASRSCSYQRRASRVDVMRTHVQPVSLHTRLSEPPGSPRL